MSFAVLIPYYKGDKLTDLKQTLDSVDLCRFDKVYMVIDGPIAADDLRFIHSQVALRNFTVVDLARNIGLGGALNAGLEKVTEDYCFRVDPGDILFYREVDKAKEYLRDNPGIHLLGGQMYEHIGTIDRRVGERRVPLNDEKIRKFSKLRNPFNHITVCFNVDVVKQLDGYPTTQILHEDYGLWIKLIRRGYNIRNRDVFISSANVDGFSSRRSGFTYLKFEINFLISNMSYFHLWIIPYLFLRIPVRFISSLREEVYKLLRLHKSIDGRY